MSGSFTVSQNALVAHKLTQLRRETLTCGEYSHIVRQISLLLAYEVTLSLPAEDIPFEGAGWKISGKYLGNDPVIVPILRTGLVMAEAFREIMPQTLTGHIGLHRDKSDPKRKILEYLVSLPSLDNRLIILLDPVIATGGTASRALDILKKHGAKNISFVSLIISIHAKNKLMHGDNNHKDVNFYCASEDPEFNDETGRVIPGLGSVSEKLFGFKTIEKAS
jgi:uracil phosphoribosyltransferase